jgi:hypothetical protein
VRLSAPKRGEVRGKRLDVSKLRGIFRDRRCWTAIGIVTKPDDGPHFTVEGDDVIIEVETQPGRLELSCRLLAPGGVWLIPAAGEEVGLVIPDGKADFMPIAIPILSSGTVPTGLATNRTVIVRDEVHVHDGSGGAESLAFQTHKHLDSNGLLTSDPTGTPIPNPGFNPLLPPSPTNPQFLATPSSGTAVLKAK